jgi:hypothetical protein
MTEETPKPWLSSVAPDRPVEERAELWFQKWLYWFGRQFGTTPIYRHPVLPTAAFLSEVNDSIGRGQVEDLVAHLCELMMVDADLVKVEIFDGADGKKAGKKRTVGHFRMRDGQAIIALDRSEFSNPQTLTAIAVHELCHLRLLGEGRLRRSNPDGERLTDLLTVYFGFGIFTTNAAMSFARAHPGWRIVSRGALDDRTLNAARNEGYSRLGYLTTAEFGYALACYCWLRREETVPAWASYVNPGPYVYLEQGLAYLKRASRTGELPPRVVPRRHQPDG